MFGSIQYVEILLYFRVWSVKWPVYSDALSPVKMRLKVSGGSKLTEPISLCVDQCVLACTCVRVVCY